MLKSLILDSLPMGCQVRIRQRARNLGLSPTSLSERLILEWCKEFCRKSL